MAFTLTVLLCRELTLTASLQRQLMRHPGCFSTIGFQPFPLRSKVRFLATSRGGDVKVKAYRDVTSQAKPSPGQGQSTQGTVQKEVFPFLTKGLTKNAKKAKNIKQVGGKVSVKERDAKTTNTSSFAASLTQPPNPGKLFEASKAQRRKPGTERGQDGDRGGQQVSEVKSGTPVFLIHTAGVSDNDRTPCNACEQGEAREVGNHWNSLETSSQEPVSQRVRGSPGQRANAHASQGQRTTSAEGKKNQKLKSPSPDRANLAMEEMEDRRMTRLPKTWSEIEDRFGPFDAVTGNNVEPYRPRDRPRQWERGEEEVKVNGNGAPRASYNVPGPCEVMEASSKHNRRGKKLDQCVGSPRNDPESVPECKGTPKKCLHEPILCVMPQEMARRGKGRDNSGTKRDDSKDMPTGAGFPLSEALKSVSTNPTEIVDTGRKIMNVEKILFQLEKSGSLGAPSSTQVFGKNSQGRETPWSLSFNESPVIVERYKNKSSREVACGGLKAKSNQLLNHGPVPAGDTFLDEPHFIQWTPFVMNTNATVRKSGHAEKRRADDLSEKGPWHQTHTVDPTGALQNVEVGQVLNHPPTVPVMDGSAKHGPIVQQNYKMVDCHGSRPDPKQGSFRKVAESKKNVPTKGSSGLRERHGAQTTTVKGESAMTGRPPTRQEGGEEASVSMKSPRSSRNHRQSVSKEKEVDPTVAISEDFRWIEKDNLTSSASGDLFQGSGADAKPRFYQDVCKTYMGGKASGDPKAVSKSLSGAVSRGRQEVTPNPPKVNASTLSSASDALTNGARAGKMKKKKKNKKKANLEGVEARRKSSLADLVSELRQSAMGRPLDGVLTMTAIPIVDDIQSEKSLQSRLTNQRFGQEAHDSSAKNRLHPAPTPSPRPVANSIFTEEQIQRYEMALTRYNDRLRHDKGGHRDRRDSGHGHGNGNGHGNGHGHGKRERNRKPKKDRKEPSGGPPKEEPNASP